MRAIGDRNHEPRRPRFLERVRAWIGPGLGLLILFVVVVLYQVCKIEVGTGSGASSRQTIEA